MDSQSPDMVNSPSHYQFGNFEAIDIMRMVLTDEQFKGYVKANVLKYILREPFKGKPLQDIQKALWHLNLYHDILAEEQADREAI